MGKWDGEAGGRWESGMERLREGGKVGWRGWGEGGKGGWRG